MVEAKRIVSDIRPRVGVTASIVLTLGLGVGAAPSYGQEPHRETVAIGPADGRLLVEEALSKGGGPVVLRLADGPSAFAVSGAAVVMRAVVQYGPFDCPVVITGRPALKDNRIGLEGGDVTTDGMVCSLALGALKGRALGALSARPWDLATRLARASADPSLVGPRLKGTSCAIAADRIALVGVQVVPDTLRVGVAVRADSAAAGRAC